METLWNFTERFLNFYSPFFASFTSYLPYMLIKGFKYLQKNAFPQKNIFYRNTVKCENFFEIFHWPFYPTAMASTTGFCCVCQSGL